MVDFSNASRVGPLDIARRLEAGCKVTDELYLQALQTINPPLLPPDMLREVVKELAPDQSRRGRPRIGAPRLRLEDIADRVEEISRPDVTMTYVTGLAERLRSGKKYREAERALSAHKKIEKLKRDNELMFLYQEIHDVVGDGPEVDHPLLGRWPVPEHGSRTDRELEVIADISRSLFGRHPPSIRRMRNIVTKNRWRFRERLRG